MLGALDAGGLVDQDAQCFSSAVQAVLQQAGIGLVHIRGNYRKDVALTDRKEGSATLPLQSGLCDACQSRISPKKEIRPVDLKGQVVASFRQALSYGVIDELLYGDSHEEIVFSLNVRSGQTACWFSLAGAGVAIVDAATVAGDAFSGLAARPYRCKSELAIHVMRHRNRPPSRAAIMFCEAFAETWKRLGPGA